MISAVSDGIMIAVIILIGILVIFIALLCVRFTLLAKIEDDYREIGIMKAILMFSYEILFRDVNQSNKPPAASSNGDQQPAVLD